VDVPFFFRLKFVLFTVAGSIEPLKVAEIFSLVEKLIALFAGFVEDTVGRTPGSSSLSQAEIKTTDSIAMIEKMFFNFIIFYFQVAM
jgi:hypothetical protein